MKIAFIEWKENKVKGFAKFRAIEKKVANIEIKHIQTGEITKVLLEAKKKLASFDAAVIFLAHSENEAEDCGIIKRKAIDIELEKEKPIFLISISLEETSAKDLEAKASELIENSIKQLIAMV